MCLLCIEIAKAKMTANEARRVLREMRTTLDKAHVAEVETKIDELDKSTTKP
jgi:hypothetical protein